VHVLGTLYLCALVVRDALRPHLDRVRQDGSDDPSGGVLDGAPDRFSLAQPARRAAGQQPGTPSPPGPDRATADRASG
jgi:hypothetical protein